MSHAELILKRAKALGIPLTEQDDLQGIQELMYLGIPNFSNASVEEIDRELKISVACTKGGGMEECERFYQNWFGEPIGCQPPPDRCPPVWGLDD